MPYAVTAKAVGSLRPSTGNLAKPCILNDDDSYSVASSFSVSGKECMCRICTCGMHPCPRHPKKSQAKQPEPGYAGLQSEYKQQYPGKEARHVSRKAPAEYQPMPGNFIGETTHNADYGWKDARLSTPIRPDRDAGALDDRPFDGTSSYVIDYPAKSINRTAPAGPKVPPHYIAKFDGTTLYKHNFDEKRADRRRPNRPEQGVIEDRPFDGTSMYRATYVPRDVRGPVRANGPAQAPLPDAPFYANTTFRNDFTQKPLAPVAPVQAEARSYDSAPFEGSSEYRDNYPRKAAAPPARNRTVEWQPSNAPFHGATTAGADYQWKDPAVQKKGPAEPRHYESAPFVATSSYADTFKETGAAPQRVTGPPGWEPTGAKFFGQTTNKADFTEKDRALARRAPMRPKEKPAERGTFDMRTSYQGAFQEKSAAPAKPAKPMETHLDGQRPFAGQTLYRSDFTEKKVDMCPVIMRPPPTKERGGHLYYES
eukprot:jgi/Mesvir1/27095/Mv20780-RA.1